MHTLGKKKSPGKYLIQLTLFLRVSKADGLVWGRQAPSVSRSDIRESFALGDQGLR